MRSKNILIEILVFIGISYNIFLAVLNNKFFMVKPALTYVVEIVIYLSCFLLGIKALGRRQIQYILSAFAFIIIIMFVRYLFSWQLEVKFARDIIAVFAFLVLGRAYRGSLPSMVFRFSLVIAIIAGFEIAMPEIYGDIVNPKSYFVNSRGADSGGFWNDDSKLYLSATRPGERNFFPGSNLPRASSVFLEPVTMGNYIIFFVAIVFVFFRQMRWHMLILSAGIIISLIVASDGRLATITSLMILGLGFLFRRLDQRLAFVIFFGVMACAWCVVWFTGIHTYQDTLLGRIYYTVNAVNHLDLPEWLGLNPAAAYHYFDSGISYFIVSQSILTVLTFLFTYSFMLTLPSREGQTLKNLAIFAFALSLLVSNSYFSIKTSALWWFACGVLWTLPSKRQYSAETPLGLKPTHD